MTARLLRGVRRRGRTPIPAREQAGFAYTADVTPCRRLAGPPMWRGTVTRHEPPHALQPPRRTRTVFRGPARRVRAVALADARRWVDHAFPTTRRDT